MSNTIIFTGMEIHETALYRGAGAYRIRTELEKAGYSCQVIDFFQHFTNEEIENVLDRYVDATTIWIGFSSTFMNTSLELKENYVFWNKIKQKYPKVKLVLGGSKTLVEEIDFIDYYVTGYADDAVVNLTNNIATFDNKIIDSNKDYDKKDLSNIPIRWKKEDYIPPGSALPMEIARGCIFNCAFCNFPMNNKKKLDYIRDANSIADELKYNYEMFGVKDYWFMDDTFNDSIQKLETLHNVISKLDFKINYSTYIKPELLVAQPDQIPLLIETGLRSAAYGIESLNPDTRQAIFKMKDPDRVLSAIKDLKVQSKGTISNQCTLIVGLPHESIESVYKANEFLYNCDYIDQYNWYPLSIHKPDNYAYTSPIDRSPATFGYITKDQANISKTSTSGSNSALLFWYNKYMNSTKASVIAKDLNKISKDRQKIYVWYRESLLTLGFDVDKHWQEHNGLLSKLPNEFLKEQKQKFIATYKAQLLD